LVCNKHVQWQQQLFNRKNNSTTLNYRTGGSI
jgi:hypothetical protein